MLKKVLLLFMVAVALCHTLAAGEIKGRVTTTGRGVEGVVVTDGVNFATTDNKGRYSLKQGYDTRFVYVSTPSGYTSPTRDGVVRFFIEINNQSPKCDFVLEPKPFEDTQHGFVAVADPQIWHEKEFKHLERAVADIRATLESYPERGFHGMGCGDIISSNHAFYPIYNEVMSRSGIQFRNCMGNHDMVNFGRSFETTQKLYEDTFGPSYYSYNVGKVHYVVLNDNFYCGRDWFYIGYLPESQLRWLEQDLSYVEPGKTVVVTFHIPSTIEPKDRAQFDYAAIGRTMANHKGLYEILKPYNAHIVSGHMHTTYNSPISANLYEHNVAALSGAWWQGKLCTDGTPKGYGVFLVDGDSISWYHKSTGHTADYQMRVYCGNDYPEFEGYVVANVWNSDPMWHVELYEDGHLKGAMERFSAYDPQAKAMYANTDKMDHKWIYPSVADHYYRLELSPTAKEIEVVAIDRFGRRYSEKIEIK